MMSKREFILFLSLQLFAILWAGLVFRIFESRLLAGAMAGTYFTLSGAYMLWRVCQWRQPWRAFCLYPLIVHVFVISLPMMISRFAQSQLAFEEIRIWGLQGPTFHRLSTTVFFMVIAATLADRWRSYRAQQPPRPIS